MEILRTAGKFRLVELGCLGHADLGHDPFLGGGDFRGGNDQGNESSVELNDVKLRRVFGIEGFVKLSEVLDFDTIDLLDNEAFEFAHMSSEAVVFDTGENNDIFMFPEEPFGDIVGEELAEASIVEVEGCEEIEVQRLEDETGIKAVSGSFLIADRVNSREGKGLQGELFLDFFSVAKEGEGDFISGKFPFHDFVHVDEFGADADVAGAVDFIAVDREKDIAALKNVVGGALGDDIGDENSFTVGRHVVGLAHGWVEKGEGVDADVHVVIVGPVFDILEEAVYHWCGDNIANIVGLRVPLKSDSNDFAILDHRSAGVSRVDGGVDLNDEVGICPGVAVAAEINPGDHALGYRESFPTHGVADGADAGLESRHSANLHDGEVLEGAEVLEFHQGEVAIVGDMFDLCDVLPGGSATSDKDPSGVGDNMGVGQDLIGADNKARSRSSLKSAGVPGGPIVRSLGGDFNFHHRVIQGGLWGERLEVFELRGGEGAKNGGKE